MKNGNFEARRHRNWKPIKTRPVIVTRAMLIRALAAPERTRCEVMSIVSKYVGNSPVPPAWSRIGVRGTFGRKVERLWSRHIKDLRVATYREAGRNLTPVVQTAYDFGSTPEELRQMADKRPGPVGSMIMSDLTAMVQSAQSAGDPAPKSFPCFLDEWGYYATSATTPAPMML